MRWASASGPSTSPMVSAGGGRGSPRGGHASAPASDAATDTAPPPCPCPLTAVPANSDAEGYLEADKPGLKHHAVRASGRDSTFRPPVSNIAPRGSAWTPPTPAK